MKTFYGGKLARKNVISVAGDYVGSDKI